MTNTTIRRAIPALVLVAGTVAMSSGARRATFPLVRPNLNVARAGVRRGDTRTVTLEAKVSEWRADGDRGR